MWPAKKVRFYYYSYSWVDLEKRQQGFGRATLTCKNGKTFDFEAAENYARSNEVQGIVILSFQEISKEICESIGRTKKSKTEDPIEVKPEASA